MKQIFLLLITLCLFSCTKKTIDKIDVPPIEQTPPPQKVIVYFSTQTQNTLWYLYTVKNNDTIVNFSTNNTPYYLQLWYTNTLPNGLNTGYSHLELMTETEYLFGILKANNWNLPKIYEPLKTYKFHIKDTLNTGVISIFVNN